MSKSRFSPESESLFSGFESYAAFGKLQEWGEQQDYKFTAILYPDCNEYFQNRSCDDILSIVRNWGFKEWYYILHDKDVKADGLPKKPHYHVLLKCSYPSRLVSVANILGIPANYLQRVRSFKSMARYLVHDEVTDKTAYLAEEVVCSDAVMYSRYFDSASESEDAKRILEYLVSSGCMSFIQLVEWCCQNDLYATLRRNASFWSNCIKEMQRYSGKEF